MKLINFYATRILPIIQRMDRKDEKKNENNRRIYEYFERKRKILMLDMEG